MRLIEIYTKLKDIKTPTFNYDGNSYYPIDITWEEIKYNYQKILTLQEESNIVLIEDIEIGNNIYNLSGKALIYSDTKYKLDSLFMKISAFHSVLQSICMEHQLKNTINIKLQNNIENLESFSNTISNISSVLKILRIYDYKIVGVDRGSNWLEIIIKDDKQLALLLAICFGVSLIYTNLQKGRNEEAQTLYYNEKTKTEKIQQELLSQQLEKAKQLSKKEQIYTNDDKNIELLYLKNKVDNLIKDICSKFHDEHKTPQVENFKGSELETSINSAFYKVLELIEEEVEIKASLNPPEWLKEENGYKTIDCEAIKKLTKTTKQIEHKEDIHN